MIVVIKVLSLNSGTLLLDKHTSANPFKAIHGISIQSSGLIDVNEITPKIFDDSEIDLFGQHKHLSRNGSGMW